MLILKRLVSLLSGPMLVIGLLLGALMLFQDRLLYFPSKVAIDNYAQGYLELWPHTNEVLGLISHPENNESAAGIAIVFHGNAGHAGHRSYYADELKRLGMRTILAEYPGYGPRTGKPSEDVLISDGVNIVTKAHQQYGEPLWLIGESLGAGVAAAVLREVPALVRGIVLITPWNRLQDVAAFHYPYLPVRWLLKSDYDSIEALAEFAGPKMVVVADNDRIVPAELGIDLFDNISEPKQLIRLENAAHNDWINFIEPEFWQTTTDWLLDASGN